MNTNDIEAMATRIKDMPAEIRGWYQGFSDAGFWASGFYSQNEPVRLPAPDLIVVTEHTGYIKQDFDPGLLWDLIIWGDDGGISLFRIFPQQDESLNQILIEFSTTEQDIVPDWHTPSREDFIAEYARQRLIIESKFAYIPGSNR